MIRRPPRSTQSRSSAASDVYKRQHMDRYESYLWHTIAAINAAWCVALCVEPPLGVRLTPSAAGSSPQVAASAESLLTDAERSNRRFTCLLHISDVTPVRHAQGILSILRAFVACAAAVQTAVLVLFGPSCLGHYRPLQRRSASDKCSVRCRPIKQKRKFTATFIKTYLPSKFLPFFQRCTANIAFGTIFEEVNF